MNHPDRNRRTHRLLACVLASICAFAARDVLAVAVRLDSFAPPRKSSTGAVRKGTDLMKVTLDLVQHPDAICNDGSPGVIYVRRASVAADENKWVLYLQGGGSCHSFEECLARWTHTGSNYGAHKMSTDTRLAPAGGVNYLAPPGIRGGGILSRNAANSFATWNQVFLYYCSSDEWTGQASSTTYSSAAGAFVGDYFLHFHGADILDAVIADLRAGVSYDSNRDHEIDTCLPSIDNASIVLFTGSSAGGNGVKHNADRLGADLITTNPGLDFRAVVDAVGMPDLSAAVWPAPNSYVGFFTDLWNHITLDWNARVDDSCLAAYGAADQYHCADSTNVLLNYLDTPFLHRMDLQDSNAIDTWLAGFGTRQEFSDAVEAQLLALAVNPAPQVFGPICGDHVGIDNDRAFRCQQIGAANGPTYHDTLLDWVNGIFLAGTVDTWQGGAPSPFCSCP
jgi:Pectinacetylesterase